ncbi:MAG: DEAD/DEAH box helicase [Anaerolineae bacterium]|nr:DEAD/DEAH box helicase [Anaerolineae bacterium]
MIVLHGSWLPNPTPGAAGEFIIWGETSEVEPQSRRRGRRPQPRPDRALPHPFQVTTKQVLDALRYLLPGVGLTAVEERGTRAHVLLPSSSRGPLASPQLIWDDGEGEEDVEPSGLGLWEIAGLPLTPTQALALLVPLPLEPHPGVAVGSDLRFWNTAAKFALELLARQRFMPALVREGSVEPPSLRAIWQPVLDEAEDQERVNCLVRAMPPVCRGLKAAGRSVKGSEPVAARALVESFLGAIVDAAVREWGAPSLSLPRRRDQPLDLARLWLAALFSPDGVLDVPTAQRSKLAVFYDQWRAWTEQLRVAGDGGFRICFRLEPPEQPALGQPDVRDWVLRFFLQATDDLSLLVPAGKVWRERGSTLRFLNRRFEQPQERLLAGLGLASRMFPPLERSLRSARPEACALTVHEAYTFLRETALLLESSGFGVLVPPWWHKRGARLGVRLQLSPSQKSSQKSEQVVSSGLLSLDSLVQYNWQLSLGDEPLSREEFDKLAALKMPLVQIRGQWVELQPEQVEAAIRFWEAQRDQGEMSLREALRMSLAQDDTAGGLPVTGVEATGWIKDMLQQLTQAAGAERELPLLSAPQGFVGELRPYQARGFSWLAFLRHWGLGACLADDMGLGKTIQAIALLLHDRERGYRRPTLIVCPTSVVGNWQREVARFAPGLRVMVHHGSDRLTGEDFVAEAQQHDLVISSYSLVRRDEETLSAVQWGGVILDEAQNIKNPSAKQSQAARRLPADYRLALTGTPVENRLSELWSIMEFLNPGYLGSREKFRQRFALPIERYQDEETARRLKSLIGPFVLRRVKTDPRVIQDLPEKMEMKVYCNLTPEQATLYEAVVRDSLRQIEEAEGIQRRGVVLSTLLKLKQVCNHPAQFLGDGSALADRSGKLARLTEMLEEALSVGDRALVFTQFAEMGEMLKTHLQATFGGEVLFLHGGTPVKQRERMIARFQEDAHGPAIFVLSLKAGGLGLNLTRANHVFHFDRWWNPAVENQATDRAFRIGQTRDVLVHKFICVGTMEERIDELIESKKALAETVIGTGEAWLTELSTEQLRDLFTLRREAVGE